MRMEARKAEIVFKSNLLATPYIASRKDAFVPSMRQNGFENKVHIHIVRENEVLAWIQEDSFK